MHPVEYGHQDVPEWTVTVWWGWRRVAAYEYEWWKWVPRAIDWGLFVPPDIAKELEGILREERVTADRSAPDLSGSTFRPTNPKQLPLPGPRPHPRAT